MPNQRKRTVRWEEMFPDELLQAIRDCPVCYCAYGLAEPHGAYNALGLDWLKAQALVERAAWTHGGVVAPPFCWHTQEAPTFDFFAHLGVRQSLCSSIPGDLFYHIALHQIRAIDARGFQAAILVTGHYGGPEYDLPLLCEYYTRHTGSPLRLHACSDGQLINYQDYHGDHAGICETSQLIALRPESVDLERRESESPSGPWAGYDFPEASGVEPSRELGEKIVASQIARLGEIQRKLLDSYRPREGWIAPSQNRVEEVWHSFQRLTRKYWWESCTWDEYYRDTGGGPPSFPGWGPLGE